MSFLRSRSGGASTRSALRRGFTVALLTILAFLILTVIACGGDEEENGEAPATVEENGGGEEVSVQLSADNLAFDTDTITVPAGSRVVMEFTNHEAQPHNFAAYESEAAEEEIFVGEIITGPDETITYEFDAPDEPGTYFFRCDVHPVQMVGDFVVE